MSVVVTTFEQASFLGEAIESVRNQTTSAAEIVVVDDGSTDRPSAVVERFAEARMVSQPNRGLAAARNRGLLESSGEFVLFLDADDRLLPEAIESQLGCFRSNPECALVYGAFYDIDERGRRLRAPELRVLGPDPFAELLGGNVIGMHAAILYRRECLTRVGGFEPTLRACEDIDLLVRVARNSRIACHSTRVAEYRKHGANMSNSPSRMLRAAIRMLARNRDTALARPEWERAHRSAAEGWKRHYVRVFVRAARSEPSARPPTATLVREAAQLLTLAPLTLVEEWRR